VAPPVNFPAAGPDLTVFNILFVAGVVLALLGYLTGSRRLRTLGILLLFGATAALFAIVFLTPALAAATVSSVFHLAGAPALAGEGVQQE
jgi:predicted membrane protein